MGSPSFKNAVLDKLDVLYRTEELIPSLEACSLAFSETPSTSKVRQSFVDLWAWSGNTEYFEEFEESGDTIHPEFAAAAFKAILKRMNDKVKIPYCDRQSNQKTHVCRHCKYTADASDYTIKGRKHAPFHKSFCKNYHEHDKMMVCHRMRSNEQTTA